MSSNGLKIPQAPADWRMSRDQMSRVQSDPRLQRLSRDELYLIFNQPKAAPTKAPAQPARQSAQKPQGRGLGWVADQITRGLRGGK